jgi:hypothetical protein
MLIPEVFNDPWDNNSAIKYVSPAGPTARTTNEARPRLARLLILKPQVYGALQDRFGFHSYLRLHDGSRG